MWCSSQATTWYKVRHKISPEHNIEHNRPNIRALTIHPIIIDKNKRILVKIKHNSLELNCADLIIKLYINCVWHNCNFYGHNIEHNRQLLRALLKSIIGKNLSIIGQGLYVCGDYLWYIVYITSSYYHIDCSFRTFWQ